MGDSNAMNQLRYEVVKAYPPRGPLSQRRLKVATAFQWFRCGVTKRSKLVTLLEDNWLQLLCNGCYGNLLAVYQVQAGDENTEQKVELLSTQLLLLLSANERRQAVERVKLRDRRTEVLDESSVSMLATAEHVASHLLHTTGLDWSAAVIGLCKAVEIEMVRGLVEPLKEKCRGVDLSVDLQDADMKRLASYCSGRSDTPPELGAVRHFLVTAANSKSRQATSPLLMTLRDLMRDWPHSSWLLGVAPRLIDDLTKQFRNPASHTATLEAGDYDGCVRLAVGSEGLLWSLLRATSRS